MTQIKATDTFYSVSSISAWSGVKNGVLFLGDETMPYVEKNGLFYYFGRTKVMHKTEDLYTFVYNLICTSERDLGAN